MPALRVMPAPAAESDFALRPKLLADFTGQEKVTRNLRMAIDAANQRQEQLDHVLLYGPPGLGKTTLSCLIANELQAPFSQTTGPTLKKFGQVHSLMRAAKFRQVVFIDEIHRLHQPIEEVLGLVLEDFRMETIIGARVFPITVQKFTCVGATTRAGMISGPLKDRFGIVLELELYTTAELQRIVTRSAGLLGCEITPEAALALAGRARGTPRIANRLLRRTRDFAQVHSRGLIDADATEAAMGIMGIDRLGLDESDLRLLRMIEGYQGEAVGLNTMAATLGMDKRTIEEVIEPWLLKLGFLALTSRGRMLTENAMEHLAERIAA